MKKILLLLCFSMCSILLFTMCHKDFETFEYTFSIESVSNHKMTFSFDNQKKYRTEVQNYFMDRRAHTSEPQIETGILTDEQYNHLYGLIKNSDLFEMEDMYGFEEGTKDEEGLLTQIVLTADGETKYITIRNLFRQRFSNSVQELLNESVSYINPK